MYFSDICKSCTSRIYEGTGQILEVLVSLDHFQPLCGELCVIQICHFMRLNVAD